MRIASWLFVVCAAVTAISVFLPAMELEVQGHGIHRASISLYKATTDRELARALFSKYRRSEGRRLGEAVTKLLVPRMGANKAHLDDAQDAMSTMDSFDDADIRHAGIGLTVAVWALVGLSLGMAALVFGELMRDTYRRWRAGVACALAVVVAVLGVGARIGCGIAVFEANDEVGTDSFQFGLTAAAHLVAIAACGALVAIATALVLGRRKSR